MNIMSLTLKFILILAFGMLSSLAMQKLFLENQRRGIQKKSTIILDFLSRGYTGRIVLVTLVLVPIFFTLKTVLELYHGFIFPLSYFTDFKCFYLASHMTVQGLNPYTFDADFYLDYFVKHFQVNPDIFHTAPFVYPPNIIPLIFPLSYLSPESASRLFLVINLISFIFLLIGGVLLLEPKTRKSSVVYIIVMLSIFGVTSNLSLGQFSSITASLVLWSIIYARRNGDILSGVLLGFSMIKPTLSILFIIYFLAKRRFLLVGSCLLITSILGVIGLFMSKNMNILDFLSLYRSNSKIFFEDFWNSPYTAQLRIDSTVIAARLFPNHSILVSIISFFLIGICISLVVFLIYQIQKQNKSSSDIHLAEVSLIACLSLVIAYSQPTNTIILALTIAFLINCLQQKEFESNLLLFTMLSLTGISYLPYQYYWHIYISREEIPYFLRVSIGSIPNYAVLGLMFSNLFLVHLILRKNRKSQLCGAASSALDV